jgi:DNA-binding NarL/FixJ family response regulator
VVVDDHPIFRQGLRALVASQADMQVIGEVDNGQSAIDIARTLQPDVVVLDLSMAEVTALRAIEQIKKSFPSVRIVTLTRHTDRGYVQQLLRAGSHGYVLRQSESEEVVRAIRAAARDQTYIDSAVATQLVGPVKAVRTSRRGVFALLSEREEEVLRMIAGGLLNREVADRLQISIKTVESHKSNAMNKLDLDNRVDIVRYALLRGWLQEDS